MQELQTTLTASFFSTPSGGGQYRRLPATMPFAKNIASAKPRTYASQATLAGVPFLAEQNSYRVPAVNKSSKAEAVAIVADNAKTPVATLPMVPPALPSAKHMGTERAARHSRQGPLHSN